MAATVSGAFWSTVAPERVAIVSCWLLPNAAVPYGGALDPLCPLRAYERVREVEIAGRRVPVQSRLALEEAVLGAGGDIVRARVWHGRDRRTVGLPILSDSKRLRVGQFAVGVSLAVALCALGIVLAFRTERPETTPLTLLCGLLGIYFVTALSRAGGAPLDATRLFAQSLLPAVLFHLALVFPRERRAAARLPLVFFLYVLAATLFLGEFIMASWSHAAWELADRLSGMFTLAAVFALGISGHLTVQESQSVEERTLARLLMAGACASLVCLGVLSLGLGGALPIPVKRTLTVGMILLLVLVTYVVSRFGIRDAPLAARWGLSYVVHGSLVASFVYAVWFVADRWLQVSPANIDPALFLAVALGGLLVVDATRRVSWGIVERWVTPWAPQLERLRREQARAMPTWESEDDVAQSVAYSIARGLEPKGVGLFLQVGQEHWRPAAAVGRGLIGVDLRFRAASLLKARASPSGSSVLLLQQHLSSSAATELRSAGVEVLAGLFSGASLLGFATIGDLARRRLFSSDQLDFLEQVCGRAALGIDNLRLRDQVLSSARLAALGRVASELAHDLRRPIGEIYLEARQLQNDESRSALAIESRALECLDHLEALVSRGARPGAAPSEAGDIAFALEGAVSRIERLSGRRPIVRIGSSRIPPVCELRSVQRVVENLLENAFQATCEEDLVEVVVTSDDRVVKVSVRDRGCGMAPTEVARAFDAFESGKGGLGLGLTACKDIVEALGGEISISSAQGRGTEVTCVFPAFKDWC